MSIICTECRSGVYHPGLGIITATLKNKEVTEGPGFVVCSSHFEDIKDKVHSLDDLADGDIVIVDERGGYVNPTRKTLAWTEDTPRTKILGYLTKDELLQYFPQTYAFLY